MTPNYEQTFQNRSEYAGEGGQQCLPQAHRAI